MTANKSLAILNLTGEFLPELGDYFASRGVLVVDPLTSSEQHDWTHIITKDVHHFDFINETYKLSENNCHIISLSKVEDLQNFTVNNGNMVLDDCWFKGSMGAFIMDKYFQGYGGISLGDNYPSFKEEGSFNIANPFNTGEYLDRMVQKAFEAGIEALTLKTYFDHLVMYLAGLKKKGKAGLPFEVTYGVFEEIFAVQVHFFSQRLEILDVATSLSSSISRKAEEYFLNTAVQSADFFDFSYMPEVNKVVVTALWTKEERIKFENRGLMFTSLQGGVTLARIETDFSTPLTISNAPLEDMTEKVSIPSSLPEEVSKTVLKSQNAEPESAVTVKGSDEELDGSTLVKGSPETEDEALLIKGEEQLEELVQTIRGKFEEDKSVVRIAGDKLDVDKFSVKIAASVDESTQEKDMKVRSLGMKLPDTIKTGLFDFAKNLNKDVKDLDDSDLDNFQVQKLPEIIQQGLSQQVRLQAAPQKAELNEMKVQSLFSGTPAFAPGQSNEAFKALEAKLMTANSDNQKLLSQMKALTSEVRILKESRTKMAEIQMKATQAAGEINLKEQQDDQDEELRRHFQQKLNDQKSLNEQELKKLSSLLDRESKLMAVVKNEEMKARKLQIEAQHKETFFVAELEKSERQTKAKDLMLIKTKETFTKLIEKKDREVSDLKTKAEQLTKALATGPSSTQTQQIKDLEKQNQNLTKQVEVYKIKISSLASNMVPTKNEDTLKDESRKLQMINQQMKNQLDMAKKEVEKLQAKTTADNSQLMTLKQDRVKLEALLKKATLENNKEVVPQSTQSDQELKRLQAQNQILETQVKDSSQKITNLETKLVEALKPQKHVGGGDEGSKVKVTQLENSVKKLTQDLLAAKNQVSEEKKETNKLRQEKTALQNQLDKMKKEADKSKPASPKKPGGKAA
jgi:hypothetical protein